MWTESSNWLPACLLIVMKHYNARSEPSTCPTRFLRIFVRAQALKEFLRDECGQDLVEYALVAVLIALGATASMLTLAGAMSTAFTGLGTKFGTYTS